MDEDNPKVVALNRFRQSRTLLDNEGANAADPPAVGARAELVTYASQAEATAASVADAVQAAFEAGVLAGRGALLNELQAFIDGLLFEADVNAAALEAHPDAYLSVVEKEKLAIVTQFSRWSAQKAGR